MRPRVRRTTSERRILDATLDLLRDGARFTDLPVEQILVSAEISRSTFYSYFADKNELLMRLAEPFIAAYTGLADTWWQRDSSTDEATWQELAELNEDFIAVARAHREVFAALTDLGGGDSSQPRALRHLTDQYAQRMAERLVREQSDGLVSTDVIPVVTARFIITATFAAIRDHLERDDTVESDDIALARTLGHAFWFAMYGTVGHRDL